MKTFVLFHATSIAMLVLARMGASNAAVAVGIAGATAHLMFVRGDRRELLTLAAFCLAGTAVEGVLVCFGLLTFATPGVPQWVPVFWLNLGTLARGPLQVLRPRPYLTFGIVAVAAPLSFLSSDAAGLLRLARPSEPVLVSLALAFAVLFAVLLRMPFTGARLPQR